MVIKLILLLAIASIVAPTQGCLFKSGLLDGLSSHAECSFYCLLEEGCMTWHTNNDYCWLIGKGYSKFIYTNTKGQSETISGTINKECRETELTANFNKISNAIESTLTNPPTERDTTSEISKINQIILKTFQILGNDIEKAPKWNKMFNELFLEIIAKPENNDYFPNFVSTFQTTALPIAIQKADLNSPLLKVKLNTPFPKAVEDSAKLIDKDVTINGNYDNKCQFGTCPFKYQGRNWISTDLYAKQGQLVIVTIPENVTEKFSIRVGSQTDYVQKKNLEKWMKGQTYSRPCSVTQTYGKELIKTTTRLLSPYGGLIYIDLGKAPSQLGNFTLKFKDVISSPRFIQGKTSKEEWSKNVASSKSPMVELEVPGLIFTIPRFQVDRLNFDMVKCASTATKMMKAFFEMEGYEMPYPWRYVYDVAITGGGAHAGYPITDAYFVHELKRMSDVADEKLDGNIWAMPHEIGHNIELAKWNPSGLGDVANNIFAQYINEVVFKSNPINLPSLSYAVKFMQGGKKFESVSLFGKLNIFKMVQQECSWETYKKFFKHYNEVIIGNLVPKTTEKKYSLITKVLSEKCNKNLIPFFKWWKWPVLPEDEQAAQHLPQWKGIIHTLENGRKGLLKCIGNYCCEKTRMKDIDSYGIAIGSKTTDGESECANWCKNTEGCQIWTLRKSDNRCWIKNGNVYIIDTIDYTSGIKECGGVPYWLTLSSQYGSSAKVGPSKCLDGRADTLCHTRNENYPYVMMEYAEPVSVTEVNVQARNNDNASRVKNVVVTVTKTKPTKGTLVSGTQLGSKFVGPASAGQWISFKSGSGIVGKYVVVQQQYRGIINFAEVKISAKKE